MSWHTTKNVMNRRLNQNGLKPMVDAGILCQEAERLYPGLFRAVSVRSGYLRVEVDKNKYIAFKLIEGKLIEELIDFAKQKNVPPITRIRLTFTP